MSSQKSVANRIGPPTSRCEDDPVRVLIVDDHPSFRASARKLLESDGYEVVGEAADGAGAIRVAIELQPDLVLLDVQLPDVDGFQVAEQLAALEHAPEVILTSSRDGSDYGSCVEDSGARGFVPKAELSGAALSLLLG
jgi:DNA-binding NarL/FixJ family response regulator